MYYAVPHPPPVCFVSAAFAAGQTLLMLELSRHLYVLGSGLSVGRNAPEMMKRRE